MLWNHVDSSRSDDKANQKIDILMIDSQKLTKQQLTDLRNSIETYRYKIFVIMESYFKVANGGRDTCRYNREDNQIKSKKYTLLPEKIFYHEGYFERVDDICSFTLNDEERKEREVSAFLFNHGYSFLPDIPLKFIKFALLATMIGVVTYFLSLLLLPVVPIWLPIVVSLLVTPASIFLVEKRRLNSEYDAEKYKSALDNAVGEMGEILKEFSHRQSPVFDQYQSPDWKLIFSGEKGNSIEELKTIMDQLIEDKGPLFKLFGKGEFDEGAVFLSKDVLSNTKAYVEYKDKVRELSVRPPEDLLVERRCDYHASIANLRDSMRCFGYEGSYGFYHLFSQFEASDGQYTFADVFGESGNVEAFQKLNRVKVAVHEVMILTSLEIIMLNELIMNKDLLELAKGSRSKAVTYASPRQTVAPIGGAVVEPDMQPQHLIGPKA